MLELFLKIPGQLEESSYYRLFVEHIFYVGFYAKPAIVIYFRRRR